MKPKLTKQEKKLGYKYVDCSYYEDDGEYVKDWLLVDKDGNIIIKSLLDSSKGMRGLGGIEIQREITKILKEL